MMEVSEGAPAKLTASAPWNIRLRDLAAVGR